MWSADTRDPAGHPVRAPGSATYNAAIETIAARDTDTEPAPFARRVLREAERRAFDRATRRVILGDGAPWIWNFADEHFPDAIQIVDIFHAKGHLFEVARAIFGHGSEIGEHEDTCRDNWRHSSWRLQRQSADERAPIFHHLAPGAELLMYGIRPPHPPPLAKRARLHDRCGNTGSGTPLSEARSDRMRAPLDFEPAKQRHERRGR